MGTKNRELSSYLEDDVQGFIYQSTSAFLKRHQEPALLLGQLKSLLIQGQLTSCKDFIQLIIREDHALSDDCRTYLLRAQIAFEEREDFSEVLAWYKQAQRCKTITTDLEHWEMLITGILAIKDGDYENGKQTLHSLMTKDSVRQIAQYSLAHHLFWKNENTKLSLELISDLCESRPGFIKAWSLLGFTCNRLGYKQRAQEAFAHCLEHETDPDKILFYKQQLAS